MKIIKGPLARDWKIERTCKECTSVLEVEFKDLTYREEPDRIDTYCYYAFTCPVCKHIGVVPVSAVPPGAKYI